MRHAWLLRQSPHGDTVFTIQGDRFLCGSAVPVLELHPVSRRRMVRPIFVKDAPTTGSVFELERTIEF